MKRLTFIIFFLLIHELSYAEVVARCTDSKGKSYFPNVGLITKDKSGWEDDAITGGVITLTRDKKGNFDVMFLDATKRITSSVDDGGLVKVFAKDDDALGVVVIYPNNTLETYNFFKTTSGEFEYLHTTSRVGSDALVKKVSLLRGVCTSLNLNF